VTQPVKARRHCHARAYSAVRIELRHAGNTDEKAIRRAALVTVRRLRYLAPPGLLSVAG